MDNVRQTQVLVGALALGIIGLGVLIVARTGRGAEPAPTMTHEALTIQPAEQSLLARVVAAEARFEDARAGREALEAKLSQVVESLSAAKADAAVAKEEASSLRDRLSDKNHNGSAELRGAQDTVEEARAGTHELAKACVLQIRRSYDSARKAHGTRGAERQLAADLARAAAYQWCASLVARLHEKLGGTETSEVDVTEEARKAHVAYEKLTEEK